MSTRDKLLKSIASTISDYRDGEVPNMGSDHVEEWVKQFDKAVQEPILAELDHVFKKTYISKGDADKFLSDLLKTEKLAGDSPCDFWRAVSFMNIQGGGNSQREMLQVLDAVLKKQCGLTIDECGEKAGVFLYLDDVIFTGNRIKNDLTSWVQSTCPSKAQVHVVAIAFHRGGQFYAKKGIQEAAKNAGKALTMTWWRCFEIEDRRALINSSDVLRATSLPDDPLVRQYVEGLKYAPVLRQPGNVGENKFFSSEEGRNLLEQEFLKAGAKIRNECPHLNKYQRPLGNMLLETLGFGSLSVTFRNCPNNCPLALWAGDPWYPLFERKTN